MLIESKAGLKETAAACGFGSADSMARSFVRVTGVPPRTYAKSQSSACPQLKVRGGARQAADQRSRTPKGSAALR
jgi:AraC-like DNA-binding protein